LLHCRLLRTASLQATGYGAETECLLRSINNPPSQERYGVPSNEAELEVSMDAYTPDFSLQVQGVKGFCPAGEVYAKQQIAKKTIPVLSCEGPCIRGEIARLAANYIAQDVPSLARACHAETFFVPHSSTAQWVSGAERSVMIDGCFLKCHGRVLTGLVGAGYFVLFSSTKTEGAVRTFGRILAIWLFILAAVLPAAGAYATFVGFPSMAAMMRSMHPALAPKAR
jgi:hypothetical protein